jgi:WD40 repeat protein
MENQSVKIIDVDNGKELFQLMGHEGRVDDLSSSPFAVWGPNGELIVSFSEYDGTIRLWDAVNGKELWRLNWEDKRYWCHGEPVRFSPDGKQILGLSNQFIRVWDVENGQEKFVIKNDEPPCDEDNAGFLCACYSPDSKYVFASLRGCIKGWDAENGKEVFNYNVGQGINYIDISSDWKVLLGLDVDEIGILDIQSGNSRRMVVSKGESFQFGSTIAKFAPDGQHFFTIPADEWEGGPDSGPIRIWKTSPVDSICDMEDYEINEIGVVNGKIVEISDAYIIVLDVKTKKEILKIERGEFALVQGYHGCDCASIRSDGKRLAYASAEGIIQIWDIERGEQINSFKMKMFDGGMQSVEYSPDGKCLLYGFLGFEAAPSGLLTLDAETGIVLNDFPGGGSASYSPDGKYVISEFINVYDVESREEIAVLDTRELNEGGLWEVFFAPDGKHIKAVFQDEYGNKKYKSWYWPSLQELIDKARERFEDNPLTPEERRQYHLE